MTWRACRDDAPAGASSPELHSAESDPNDSSVDGALSPGTRPGCVWHVQHYCISRVQIESPVLCGQNLIWATALCRVLNESIVEVLVFSI